jgi:hypothetical protein
MMGSAVVGGHWRHENHDSSNALLACRSFVLLPHVVGELRRERFQYLPRLPATSAR